MTRIFGLAGLLLALLLPGAAPAQIPTQIPAATAAALSPHPLMWVIRDADSTIYLFGSIHVMKDGVPWLSPRIQQRFDSADELWEELPDIDDTAALAQAAQPYMVDPTHSMTDGLTADEVTQLNALLVPYGLNTQALMGVRKWAVGLIIMQKQISALGFDASIGVDMTFAQRARAAAKPIHGFETVDQQMHFLIPADAAEDLANLRATLNDADETPQILGDMLTAWEAGDEPAMTRILIDKEKSENPTEYQRVIVKRNAIWEPQVEALLNGKGTVFVTVGTAHLIGPDSLLNMLKRRGIVAEPVN